MEFAIIASAMLLLAFAVVQASLVYYAHSIALGAATQGVNEARGYRANAAGGERHAREFLAAAGTGLNNQDVDVVRSAVAVTATVRGQAISVLPGLSFSVRKTAHGPVERVTQP